jgi:hypothetical protein
MSTTITGVAADFDRGTTFTTTTAAAGEPRNIADIITPAQALADAVEDYREFGAKTDAENNFTADQEFSGKVLRTVAANANWQWMDWYNDGDTTLLKSEAALYRGADGSICLAINALWDANTSQWGQQDNTKVSVATITSLAGRLTYFAPSGLHATPWADFGVGGSQWVRGEWLDNTGSLVLANGLIVAATGINVQAGNILAGAGSVTAAGDPTSGNGIVTGVHFASTAAAAPGHTSDATNCTVTVDTTSTDVCGNVRLQATNVVSAGVLTKIQFNKSYGATTPKVVLSAKYDSSVNISNIQVGTITNADFEIYGLQGLNNGSDTHVYYIVSAS